MTASHEQHDGFRHEALLYAGAADFVAGVTPFLEEGIAAKEPILVVESPQKIELLRDALGDAAEQVLFADMAQVGSNPARIIPAWEDFVKRFGGGGRRLRGVGEPIWRGRPDDELVESQRHEALLNVAFGKGQPWWLLCPYDTSQMDESVIEEAMRSHEFVMERGRSERSKTFVGVDASGAPFAAPLEEPPAGVARFTFTSDTLLNLRGEAARFAVRNGMPAGRTALFVTALNEVATNSILHGGGSGTVRMWRQGGKVIAEIHDAGLFDRPLADRHAPEDGTINARGLWLANQLCDLVQIRRTAGGTVFRLHMKTGEAVHPRLYVVDTSPSPDVTDGAQG